MPSRPRPSRRLLTLGAAAAVLAATAPVALAATPDAATTGALTRLLTGEVPAWLAATGGQRAVDPASEIDLGLVVPYRDAAGLSAFDASVSDPASRDYRHFLTTAQFDARYAPSTATVRAVETAARALGLSVTSVASSRVLVEVRASAATVERDFATRLVSVVHDGARLHEAAVTPLMPTALSLLGVSGVAGLSQELEQPAAAPPAAFVNARPCTAYYGQTPATSYPKAYGAHAAYTPCGYTPTQVRSAYGINTLTQTGKGVSIGIVDAFASPTLVSDVDTYSHLNKLPAPTIVQTLFPGATSLPEGPGPTSSIIDPEGWSGEETLDFEAAHTIAPAATLHYFAATDPVVGLYVAELEAVESGDVQIVSNSWGEDADSPEPGEQQLFDEITAQAGAKGVTLVFASGDDGDEVVNDGARQVDFPADSPDVTAVGGTTLRITKSGGYGGEEYWGTDKSVLMGSGAKASWSPALPGTYLYGGGGGVSTLYPEPSWQQGVVPTSLATFGGVTPGRVVPDVAMLADPNTGLLIGQTQTFPDGSVRYSQYRIGGTSLATPLTAGVLALAEQVHGALGSLDPALYALYRAHPSAFRDQASAPRGALVRVDYANDANASAGYTVSLRTLGVLGTLHALKGYDDSTGLGSPVAAALVRYL